MYLLTVLDVFITYTVIPRYSLVVGFATLRWIFFRSAVQFGLKNTVLSCLLETLPSPDAHEGHTELPVLKLLKHLILLIMVLFICLVAVRRLGGT